MKGRGGGLNRGERDRREVFFHTSTAAEERRERGANLKNIPREERETSTLGAGKEKERKEKRGGETVASSL